MCRGAGRSSIHAVFVEKAGPRGVIVARASMLDVETTAELRRLRELERRYKVLKEEHELLKKAIRFTSDRKRKSSPSSK